MKVNSKIVRVRMKELDLTQVEVAKKIGITQAAFSKMLRNGRTFEETVSKLSQILRVPIGELGELNSGESLDILKPTRQLMLESELEKVLEQRKALETEIHELRSQIKTLTGIIDRMSAKK